MCASFDRKQYHKNLHHLLNICQPPPRLISSCNMNTQRESRFAIREFAIRKPQIAKWRNRETRNRKFTHRRQCHSTQLVMLRNTYTTILYLKRPHRTPFGLKGGPAPLRSASARFHGEKRSRTRFSYRKPAVKAPKVFFST